MRPRTAPTRPEHLHVMMTEAEAALLRDVAARLQTSQAEVVREALRRFRREVEASAR